jgi:DNA polymerase/3'-5' exonuclease PolX
MEGEAMENVEIARVLNHYADLLDIEDENPFRVRSYRKAAQTVEGLSRPVAQLIEAGTDLTKLPGIGGSMAEHIQEILHTGTLAALADKRQEFPETQTALLQLEQLGPKRARRLYDELAITSRAELAEALDAGKIEALPGFGKKTAENLRHAIKSFEQYGQRFLLADAEQLIHPQWLDLNDVHVYRARDLGVKIVIDSEARSVDQPRFMHYGVDQERRVWIGKRHRVNTMQWPDLRRWLRRGH